MSVESINKVYLGLPAYNEKDSIAPLFEKVEALTKTSPIPVEVLLYDDGCTDGTKEAVNAWQDRLTITYLDGVVNKGLGAGMNALLSHFVKAAGKRDVLVIMDCDDTHDPAQIPQMIKALDKMDVVVASRYRKGSFIKGVPPLRIVTGLGAALLYKTIHPARRVRDYTCGFRMYTHQILSKAMSHYTSPLIKERGFACMVELLLKLIKCGAKVNEIPMRLRYDNKRSASKMDVSSNTMRLLKKLVDWRIRGMA